jgi:organic radical activating enzyme
VAFARGENQVSLDEAEVAARIAALGQARLVVTGGEPLMQGVALARMLGELKARVPDLVVEVETNGTVAPAPALDPLIDQFNVSPKLAHSGNPASLALVPERLAAYAADARAWFKFVIGAAGDVDEVRALAADHGIAPGRVILMPEGRNSATLRERAQWLGELCLSHGYRLGDRLHIHLSGDTRGT